MEYNPNYAETFTRGVLASTLITNVYKLVEASEWDKAAVALTLVRLRFCKDGDAGSNNDYFTWMSGVFTRVYILKLLI